MKPRLGVSRVTAILLGLAVASTGASSFAHAGVAERVKTGIEYMHALVGGGMARVEEGMLDDLQQGDLERRTNAFFGRQTGEGIRTFAEVVADGHGRVAAGWKGLKAKLADTLVGKAASAVKDRLWGAVASERRRIEPRRVRESRLRAVPPERTPGEGSSWDSEESERVRTLAEIEADGEVPETFEAGHADEERSYGAGEVDPLIALDIDEDERDWYRNNTLILDEAPWPAARVFAHADASSTREWNGERADPPHPSDRACDDVWAHCLGDTGGAQAHQKDTVRRDQWIGYDESQDTDVGADGARYDGWRDAEDGLSDAAADVAAAMLKPDGWETWQDRVSAGGGSESEWDGQAWGDGALALHGGPDDPWDAPVDSCTDVWSDCPPGAVGSEVRSDRVGSLAPWAGSAQSPDEPEARWEPDPWEFQADDRLNGAADGQAADAAEEDYRGALDALLNVGDPSVANLPPEADGEYRMALEQMERQAAVKARIKAEEAAAREAAAREAAAREAAAQERREAERREREAAARQPDASAPAPGHGTRSADPGICGSTPACRQYIEHGERVVAQVDSIMQSRSMGMTEGALLTGLLVRSTMGCMRKCEPHETSDSCRAAVRGAIEELQQTYHSAIESALGSAAESAYVYDFDRDPGGSRFVRDLGIQISGASLDNCGE